MAAQLDHMTAFQEFSSTLRRDDVATWTKAIRAWEHDPLMPNPFELKEKHMDKVLVDSPLI
jgi:hypothetical protein